jgi:hypothetical protein
MSDFLERYGEQLRAARLHSRRRRARVLRRGTVASLVVVAIAAPAVALMEPWSPRLGRPWIDGPVSVSRAPVATSARAVLAVLRRPQTARDRRLAAPHLRDATRDMFGVQVDGIRAVSPDYALVPIGGIRVPVIQGVPRPRTAPMICLFGGGGSACDYVDQIATLGVAFVAAGRTGTRFVGLVPDGVARVRFTPVGGRAREVEVHDNFYELRIPQLGPSGRPVTPPKGYHGTLPIPAPPEPAHGELDWLDAAGRVIHPRRG